MLSYQHIYHAGNLADVHKHFLLASVLGYLTRKDKPLTYIETHAGRGLYDLSDSAAQKTGEAAAGIEKMRPMLDDSHPYTKALSDIRKQFGPAAYPGSPLLAASLLRPDDCIHLAELHPRENEALRTNLSPFSASCHLQDGFALAHSLCPPTPRRGLMVIDPSWEIKSDYDAIPRHIAKITRAWNVGIIALWYPLLKARAHDKMLATLEKNNADTFRSEVRFPPARDGHGMVGSGMFFINTPYGLAESAAKISGMFQRMAT
ncbi:MAG: 23S rRNA (adenine(2030)-N(6))-methyltransferase RlmJ [Pseudomonadota bacterium]